MQTRDESLDAIKYILIASVIFGHCLGRYCESPLSQGVYNFVNLYHMPLFIFLSGYFSKQYDLKKREERSHFLLSQVKLLETYVIFCCVHQLIVYHSIDVYFMMKFPSWSLWYLLSLFSWRMFVQLIPQKFAGSMGIIPLSFVVGLLVGLAPVDGFLSVQRTFTYLGFFMSGFVLSKGNFVLRIRLIPRSVPVFLLCLLFLCCVLFLNFDVHKIIWGFHSYRHSGYEWSSAMAFRACFYVAAMFIGIPILSLVRDKVVVLSKYGRKTLFFYVYHTLLLYGVFAMVEKFDMPTELPFVLLYTTCVILLLHLGTFVGALSFLINPISGIIQKRLPLKKSRE
ncbi:MAG: acyltransferase family protein [Fibrobacter sp.]|nr:acyltransferase family protein [Fibrobacter sp.]